MRRKVCNSFCNFDRLRNVKTVQYNQKGKLFKKKTSRAKLHSLRASDEIY